MLHEIFVLIHEDFHIATVTWMLFVVSPISSKEIQGMEFHTVNFLQLMTCFRRAMVISNSAPPLLPFHRMTFLGQFF